MVHLRRVVAAAFLVLLCSQMYMWIRMEHKADWLPAEDREDLERQMMPGPNAGKPAAPAVLLSHGSDAIDVDEEYFEEDAEEDEDDDDDEEYTGDLPAIVDDIDSDLPSEEHIHESGDGDYPIEDSDADAQNDEELPQDHEELPQDHAQDHEEQPQAHSEEQPQDESMDKEEDEEMDEETAEGLADDYVEEEEEEEKEEERLSGDAGGDTTKQEGGSDNPLWPQGTCSQPENAEHMAPELRFRMGAPVVEDETPFATIYSVSISPLEEYGCSKVCRDSPTCNGFSFFEVAVKGSDSLTSANVTPMDDGSYKATFMIAADGSYNVLAALVFFNYTNVYRHYPSRPTTLKRLEADPTYRQEFATVTTFQPLADSPLIVDLKHAPSSSSMPACRSRKPSSLPGWWNEQNTVWTPFNCRLDRLDGKSATTLADRFKHGHWLRLFGDSNTRTLFHHACDMLGGKSFSRVPFEDSHRSCMLPDDGVITFTMWWPETHVNVTERHLMRSLKSVLDLSMSGGHVAENAAAVAKAAGLDADDMRASQTTLLALGSHSYQNTLNEWEEVRSWEESYRAFLDEDEATEGGTILTMLTSASNIQWLLQAGEGMRYVPMLQNNARLDYRNERTVDAVEELSTVIDFMSMTKPLAMLDSMADAVHFGEAVYTALVEYIANII